MPDYISRALEIAEYWSGAHTSAIQREAADIIRDLAARLATHEGWSMPT